MYIEDDQGDTLLFCKSLSAQIKLSPITLIREGLVFDELSITEGRFTIQKAPASEMNNLEILCGANIALSLSVFRRCAVVCCSRHRLHCARCEMREDVYLSPLAEPKLAKKLGVNAEDRAALTSNIEPILALHRVCAVLVLRPVCYSTRSPLAHLTAV